MARGAPLAAGHGLSGEVAGIYLYLGVDGPQGPFPEEEVRQRLAAGDLPASTMSWRPGDQRWQSLSRRWTAKRRPWWPLPLCALACVLLAGFAVALAAEWIPGLPYAVRRFHASTSLSLATLALAAALAVGAWRGSVRCTGRPSPSALTCALSAAVGVLCTLPMAGLNKRLHDERVASDNATLTFDHSSGELRIAGSIGDRFVSDLRAALAQHPAARAVAIDSPGGFVDDAFEAGRILRARGLQVRVHGECASACVIVWSSAASREAGVEARFGLHQSYAEGEMPAAWLAYTRDMSNAATVALLRRVGFSDTLLAERDKAGSDGMHWVGPIELQEAGVRLFLVDSNGSRVSQSQARVFLALSGTIGARRVAEVYSRQEVADFARVGSEIHEAWRSDDAEGLFQATADLVDAARAHAMADAPDIAVVAWARRMHELLEAPVAGSDRLACRVLVDGAQAVRKRDDRLRDQAYAALAILLEATPTRTALESPSLPQLPAPEGYDTWPAQRKCSYLHRLYGDAVRLPAAEAARSIRASRQRWR